MSNHPGQSASKTFKFETNNQMDSDVRKNQGGKLREGDEQRVEYQRFKAFDQANMQTV
jgi:hypothetical protein